MALIADFGGKLVDALAAAAAHVEDAFAREARQRHPAHRREAEFVGAIAVVLVDFALIGKRHLAQAREAVLDLFAFVIAFSLG